MSGSPQFSVPEINVGTGYSNYTGTSLAVTSTSVHPIGAFLNIGAMSGSPQFSIPQIIVGTIYSNYTGTGSAVHPIYYSNTLANYFLLQMQQSDREQQIREEERRRQSDREHQIREEERRRHAEELQRFQRNSYVHSFIQEMLRHNNCRNLLFY